MANLANAFKKIDRLSKRVEQIATHTSNTQHTHPITDIAALQNKLDQIDDRLDEIEDRIRLLEKPVGVSTK